MEKLKVFTAFSGYDRALEVFTIRGDIIRDRDMMEGYKD